MSYGQRRCPGVSVPFLAADVSKTPVSRNHVEYHFAAFEFEPEVKLEQSCTAHGFAQAGLIFLAVQHQESASARPRNFAANGAVLLGQFIPMINLGIADAVGKPLLGLPMHVQQLTKVSQVAMRDRIVNLDTNVPDLV